MTAFETQLAADLANNFYNTAEFAKSYTYTPAGGDSVSVDAILTYAEDDLAEGADENAVTAMIRIQVSDVATVSAGDTLVIGSDTWEVTDPILGPDGLDWLAVIQMR